MNFPICSKAVIFPDDLLKNAASVDVVLDSEQANNCLFIGKNKSMLSSSKKVPLWYRNTLACVITNGEQA